MTRAGAELDPLRLTKHHGAGNDFLVLLDGDDRRPLTAAEVRALCDRRRGLGADGVLRARPGTHGAALSMDLANADGSVAEMSGNGIRCLVQAAVEAGMVAPGDVVVATLAGLRTVAYRAGPSAGLGWAEVEMGRPVLGDRVDTDGRVGVRWGRRVDMGNPHVVLFGATADGDTLRRVGATLEGSVGGGANVEMAWPGPGPDELVMRVWERGVGETLACGTGACAVVAAAHDRDEVGEQVSVRSRGGVLQVTLEPDGALLAGPTQRVASVSVEAAVLAALVDALDEVALDAPASPKAPRSEAASRP